MAPETQSNAKVEIEKAGLCTLTVNEFLPEYSEGNSMMMGVQPNSFTLAATCSAFLAGVVIALEYGGSPSNVQLGFSHDFLFASFAVLIVVSLLTRALFSAFSLGEDELSRSEEVVRKVFGYTSSRMHPRQDRNDSSATAMAKVLALVFSNPKVNAPIVSAGMIAGVGNSFRPSHLCYSLSQVQYRIASKLGELLETPLARAKGNQQPSRQYTGGRFRDYRSDTVRLITG